MMGRGPVGRGAPTSRPTADLGAANGRPPRPCADANTVSPVRLGHSVNRVGSLPGPPRPLPIPQVKSAPARRFDRARAGLEARRTRRQGPRGRVHPWRAAIGQKPAEYSPHNPRRDMRQRADPAAAMIIAGAEP